MNKKLLGVLVTVVAVLAVVGVVAVNNKDSNSSTASGANSTSMESMNGMGNSMGGNTSNSSQDKNAVVETDKVTMEDFAFVPAKIKVKKGTTVTWTNKDSARHDVAPDNPTAEFTEGQLIGQGENYSFTFNEVGTFSYYCSPHPYMKASVEVVE